MKSAVFPLIAICGCLVPLLAGCKGSTDLLAGSRYEAGASYRCAGGQRLRVLRNGSGVRVQTGDAEFDLPASPPDSGSRFGIPSHALVLEGSEALWMVAGEPPLACRR